jgi:hypothetical protein
MKNKHFKLQSVTLMHGLLQVDTTTVHTLTTIVRPISLARMLQATTTTDLEHGLDSKDEFGGREKEDGTQFAKEEGT